MEFFEFLMNKAGIDEIKKKIAGGLILNENNEILMLKRKKR